MTYAAFEDCFLTTLPDGRHPKGLVLSVAAREYRPMFAKVNEDVIRSLPHPKGGFGVPSVYGQLPPSLKNSPQGTLFMLLSAGSLNFRFWKVSEGVVERYEHAGKAGASAMFSSFVRAWGNDVRPQFQVPVSEGVIERIFGSIPDVQSRLECLNEILTHDSSPMICEALVAKARQKRPFTQLDAESLSKDFPLSYGHDPFMKKAQFILSMMAGTLSDFGLSTSVDLTAFADYRVPQVLRSLGVLSIHPVLEEKVENSRFVFGDSDEEKALRAATIIAVNRLSKVWGMSESEVDCGLWMMKDAISDFKFHLMPGTEY